jgi:hypothetical protein
VIHITFFAKCDPDHVSAQMHGVSFQGYGLAETTCRRVLPAMSTRKPAWGTTLVATSDNRLRLVSDSDAHLRSVIATLEENRASLVESANPEAAQILAVAILQLRMRLNRIGDSELKALCHAVQLQQADKARKAAELASRDGRPERRWSSWPNVGK